MRAFLCLLRAELLLHRRSVRSRLVAILYLLLTLLPWPLFKGQLAGAELIVGPATALALIAAILPYTTLLLAAGLAGRGADRASREELLPLLAGSPCSNAAVVASRALALLLLFLGVTALPFLGLGLVSAVSGPPADPIALLLGWLLQAWPMAVAIGWTWLALALIGGSDLAAGLLLWFGGLSLGQLAQLASRWETFFGWPFFTSPVYFRHLVTIVLSAQRRDDFWWILPGLVASEGPADPRLAFERAWVDFAPALGLAVFLLAIAAQRLGRCRADLRPRDFSRAPSLGRLRQFLAFDGGLGRAERSLAWLALLAAAGALLLVERQARAFYDWGAERYAAETQDLGPATDPAVILLGADLHVDLGDAALFPSGRLRSTFRERFANRGAAPQSRLSFALDSRLTLGELAASIDGAPVELKSGRKHDRLWLELARPLPPGASFELAGTLEGRPATPQLGIVDLFNTGSFTASWEALVRDRAARRATRFAAADLHPAISRNQVRLAAEQLMPLPRYTAWKLPQEEAEGAGGNAEADATPAEESRERAPIALELRAPAAWRLFDACARASELVGGRSVLAGSCTIRPGDYLVRGGSLMVQESGQVALATLPQHAAASAPLLEALAGIHARGEQSWPGAPPLGKVLLIEDLKYFEPGSLQIGTSRYNEMPPVRARGSLLEVAEQRLIFPSRFDPLELAGPLLADRLLASRRLAPEDSWAITTLVREVVAARLGLRSRPAILGGAPWLREAYAQPLASYRWRAGGYGAGRLAALMADLGGRLGAEALQLGIADFLAGGPAPGTLGELLAALEKRSGQPLERFRADFFDQGGLPQLALAEVRNQGRAGGDFVVSGLLRNAGTGEVICPLVLRTDRGELWQKVRVGSQAATPFAFTTAQRPLLVELDPAATCLRFRTSGEAALEKVQL